MKLFKNKEKKVREDRILTPLSLARSIDAIAAELNEYYQRFPDKAQGDALLLDDLYSLSNRLEELTHKEEPNIHFHGR